MARRSIPFLEELPGLLDSFRSFFARRPAAPTSPANMELEIAACALLLELAHADDEFTADERAHIEDALVRHFALDAAAARELMEIADRERNQATDLHQFTSVITDRYDEGQRMVLAEILWRIVYADGRLSHREDLLTQKLSRLLDLRPGYLAAARKRAGAPPSAGE
jgi:uncharacterized tellurite resistance protein B-like protein